jgi:hypothetical protein
MAACEVAPSAVYLGSPPTSCARGGRLLRRPSLSQLPEAGRALAKDVFLRRRDGGPLPAAKTDPWPLGRVEGIHHPLAPLVVVGGPPDVPRRWPTKPPVSASF